MTEDQVKKVYQGLVEVDRAATYHLGFYQIDFPDGSLTFELLARICSDERCLCDNIAIEWHTQGRVTHTWYTAEQQWLDEDHRPMPDEMTGVFRIAEATDKFQERYRHLAFLRRQQVLTELGRAGESFNVHLPGDLVEEGTAEHTLGKVRPGSKGGKSLPYAIEFCGDHDCYCNNLFVAVIDKSQTTSFCVDPQNQWSSMSGTPDSERLMQRVQPRLSKSELFDKQLTFLRTERMLHNYHRYVTRYQKENKVGL